MSLYLQKLLVTTQELEVDSCKLELALVAAAYQKIFVPLWQGQRSSVLAKQLSFLKKLMQLTYERAKELLS